MNLSMADQLDKRNVLAIIPARGGSKKIPDKNIIHIANKPLIAWSIETAQSCAKLTRVIISTDSEKIAEISRSYGADVPFLRPAELAQDDSHDFFVYEHALTWLAQQENYFPDIVVWLRPTAPLRTIADIEASIDLLIETKADWVRSICPVEHHPYWMKQLDRNRLIPFIEGIDERKYYQRQLLPPAYRLNGAVEVTWAKTILEKKLRYSGDVCGYVMPVERSIDVDHEMDLKLLNILLERKQS